jgi:hypothetical protein
MRTFATVFTVDQALRAPVLDHDLAGLRLDPKRALQSLLRFIPATEIQ